MQMLNAIEHMCLQLYFVKTLLGRTQYSVEYHPLKKKYVDVFMHSNLELSDIILYHDNKVDTTYVHEKKPDKNVLTLYHNYCVWTMFQVPIRCITPIIAIRRTGHIPPIGFLVVGGTM